MNTAALFHPGRVVATRGAAALIRAGTLDAGPLLQRHLAGDWGDVCAEDAEENNFALLNGSRLLSAYKTPAGKIWIITDASMDDGDYTQRQCTTLLLPEEY